MENSTSASTAVADPHALAVLEFPGLLRLIAARTASEPGRDRVLAFAPASSQAAATAAQPLLADGQHEDQQDDRDGQQQLRRDLDPAHRRGHGQHEQHAAHDDHDALVLQHVQRVAAVQAEVRTAGRRRHQQRADHRRLDAAVDGVR
ncbi:MAG: hypothetical protein WCH61_07520, partial [bacterium]